MMLATIRPDAWNLPLFVHVAGALALVASLMVVTALAAGALRGGDGAAVLTRLGFRTLLVAVLPSYVVMRAGAEWINSKEDFGDPAWLGIGYSAADGGLLLIVVATILAWRATRRGTPGPGGLGRGVLALSALVLLGYAVAIWAMTTKPG